MPWSKVPQQSVARTTPPARSAAAVPRAPAADKDAGTRDRPLQSDDTPAPRRRDFSVTMVNESNVIATMFAFNKADESYARLAVARSQNAQVRAYATRMLSDNAAMNQLATDLLTRTDIQPEDDETSFDLREISAAHRDKLKSLTGWAFDAAYVAGEATYHEQLLVRIDHVLLPSARNPELKKLVQSLRPTVAAHLAQAQQLAQVIGAADDR